jgi:poly(3-hydroxybutyrate) depolymerase
MMQAAKVEKDVTIKIDGEDRKYKLYVPNNIKNNCPFVLSLHGANGSSNDKSPFGTDVADWAGCIVAYPQGKMTASPIGFGGSATGWTASGEDNFDVKFLKAVIEDVASKYTIDRKRLYCCGFSNGGMMTYAMSNVCSDVFAAFASISGYPINEFHLRHTGKRPVPFLHIHGKADDFVKYSLVPNVIDNMVARNGANPVPEKTTVSGKYTKSIYEAGEDGFPIVFYEIDGMGHNDFTNNTEDNSSAQTMWNFFKQYTLDSPCDKTLKWRPCVETEGYEPKEHGWGVNGRNAILKFGGDLKTDENQNVYRSLQFKTGSYKLSFQSEGDASLTVRAKIQKLTGKQNLILDATVQAGSPAVLPFEVTDGWGEYQITFLRANKNDVITVSNIAIYSSTEENNTGIHTMREAINNNCCYDILGRQVTNPKRGMYIKNGKKVFKVTFK